MNTSIPLVDLVPQQAEIMYETLPRILSILERAAFVGGAEVADFERDYAALVGATHCIGVANGTDALEIALRAGGVSSGDEVIIPANTFIATAEAVVRAGAVPVLVDVDEDHLLMDPNAVADAVTSRTRAVVPVHLFGQCAPVEQIAEVGGARVAVIEDAAQSQGATRFGRGAGTLGAAAGTSFYPGKNLGAAGDAGAVTTDDERIARSARLLSNHGSLTKYVHETVGFNSRLDTIQAVVLTAKLARLDKWNDLRQQAASRYAQLLADVPAIVLPTVMPGNVHVWHLFVVRVQNRDLVLKALRSQGIDAGIHYPAPLHRTNAFAGLGSSSRDLTRSERAADEILSLPMFPHITEEQQQRVVDALREAVEHP